MKINRIEQGRSNMAANNQPKKVQFGTGEKNANKHLKELVNHVTENGLPGVSEKVDKYVKSVITNPEDAEKAKFEILQYLMDFFGIGKG